MFTSKLLFYESDFVTCPALYGSFCLFTQDFTSQNTNATQLNITSSGCYCVFINGAFVCAADCRLLSGALTYDVIPLDEYIRVGKNNISVYVFSPDETPKLMFSVIRERKILAVSGEKTFCHTCGADYAYSTVLWNADMPDCQRQPVTVCEEKPLPVENPISVFPLKEQIFEVCECGRYTVVGGKRYTVAQPQRPPVGRELAVSGDHTYLKAAASHSCHGFAVFELTAKQGDVVELEADNTPKLIYTCRDGRQRFCCFFAQTTGKEITLCFPQGGQILHSIGFMAAESPRRSPAKLQFGDQLHEKIYNTCLKRLKSDALEYYAQDGFFTCPDGVGELFLLIADLGYCYGDYSLSKAIINNICYRLTDENAPQYGGPVLVICISQLLLSSGDRNFAKSCIPTVKGIIEHLQSGLGEDRLMIGDRPGQSYMIDNCLFVMAIDAAVTILREFSEDTDRLLQLRTAVIAAIERHFWDRCAQLYATEISGSIKRGFDLLTQALAIISGEASRPRSELTAQFFFAKEAEQLPPLPCSQVIAKYVALLAYCGNAKWVFKEHGKLMFEIYRAGEPSRILTLTSLYLYYRYCVGIEPKLRGFTGYSFLQEKCGFTYTGSIYTPKYLFTVDKTGQLKQTKIEEETK